MRPFDPCTPSLSPKETLILGLLASGGEMYGLQLVAESQGQLKRGTIYVTLGRMEAKGFVLSREEIREQPSAGLPRRLYAPTALGLRVYQAWQNVAHLLSPIPEAP